MILPAHEGAYLIATRGPADALDLASAREAKARSKKYNEWWHIKAVAYFVEGYNDVLVKISHKAELIERFGPAMALRIAQSRVAAMRGKDYTQVSDSEWWRTIASACYIEGYCLAKELKEPKGNLVRTGETP